MCKDILYYAQYHKLLPSLFKQKLANICLTTYYTFRHMQ